MAAGCRNDKTCWPSNRRGVRKPTQNRRQGYQRDACLFYFACVSSKRDWSHDLHALGHQELATLSHGHIFAVTNAMSKPTMLRPSSRRADISPASSFLMRQEGIPSVSREKQQDGTTTISPASLLRDFLHRIPLDYSRPTILYKGFHCVSPSSLQRLVPVRRLKTQCSLRLPSKR